MMKACPLHWSKAIILVDMNAFFASIEQLDQPEWRGLPIAVTNGPQGSCIITCSYEARAYGIKTGMRLYEARKKCPTLIQAPSRPRRYTEVSRAIMTALQDISPQLEIFSVDEAFLDVTHCQLLFGTPARIGQLIKEKIYKISGLACSIGISGDKTTAKFAAKLRKPNGFVVIPPWEAKATLAPAAVTELCGINTGIGNFLRQRGATSCGDVAKLPISVLAKRFGNLDRRIWYMCQGQDPAPVTNNVSKPKSIGHGKVLPPNTKDLETLRTFLLHMCTKVGTRLRKHNMTAQYFFIGLRTTNQGWIAEKIRLAAASNDHLLIYKRAQQILTTLWSNQTIKQVQVTALDPKINSEQLDLFMETNPQQQALNQAVDSINQRYGELTVCSGSLLNRSNQPNVISPAWRPNGHRQTI